LEPVQNVEIRVSAGRPIVSYSFVMKLTDSSGQPVARSEWSKLVFTPNSKLTQNASDFIGSHDVPDAKLFVGTIGQKPDGVTRIEDTVNSGKLGSFSFTPSENQQDLRLSFYLVPGKPESNSVYVLGRLLSPPAANGEVQIPQENMNTFSLHNPFNSGNVPTPTPVGHDIEQAGFLYSTANGAAWQEVVTSFDSYNVGGTLKTRISVDDVDPIWQNSSLAPSFRLKVKTAAGTYRQTTANGQQTDVLVQGGSGTFAGGEFWANWKVTGTALSMFLTVPGTTDKFQITRGDTVEVTVNLKRIDSNVVYNCTVNNQVVVYPLGQPENQQVIGPCANYSKATLVFETPVPTNTPEPPPAANSCQCDLGVVMSNNCDAGYAPTCSSQVVCACLPTTATATPTSSPAPIAGSCPMTQIPPSQWVGPGNSSASCSATGITYTWKDPYTNETEWRIYAVTASGSVGQQIGTVPASNTATKSFRYSPTGFNPTNNYKIKIRAVYSSDSTPLCYQEAQISKLCQP
ncbi:hypothetical protein KC921_01660, partial [Candidatus Woesebacteria bacterium]|nr:hypothetical protein [Candidatus Woesebacteria bacterium]